MSSRSIRLLAATALLCAGAAHAEIVGPVTWYSGSIDYVCNGEASGRVISEPSLSLCQYYLQQELDDPNNADCEMVDLHPCSFHFHGFSGVEQAVSHPAELNTNFGNEEGVLRQRYRIDEYEAEMGKLIRRLQPRK